MATNSNPRFIQKLMTKWNVNSALQVLLILLTFCLTGTTVVFLKGYLFQSLGYDTNTPFWQKAITYLLFVFPAYQVLILVFGALLGQFQFFWEKERKLLQRLGIISKPQPKTP